MKEFLNIEKIYEFNKDEISLSDVIKFKDEISETITIEGKNFLVNNKTISVREFSYLVVCGLIIE